MKIITLGKIMFIIGIFILCIGGYLIFSGNAKLYITPLGFWDYFLVCAPLFLCLNGGTLWLGRDDNKT